MSDHHLPLWRVAIASGRSRLDQSVTLVEFDMKATTDICRIYHRRKLYENFCRDSLA
jgi:hypothetical protein